jgi:magnesium transporter
MLINCVAYKDGRKLADVDVSGISDYLERRDCFVWVALKDATEEEIAAMQTEFDLPELAVEDVRNGHQRPKVEEYGSIVFAVMQLVEPIGDELSVGEVGLFVSDRFVLSIRSRSQQNFLGVRARCESEPELLAQGPGFVFYAIMDIIVDRYFPLLDAIETELDAIEMGIFARDQARQSIERLYELKRKTMTLRHAALPMLEFVGKLHGGRVPRVCANYQDYFRDIHDHLSRIIATLDGVRDTITTAIQVNLSMVTIEESEVTKKLAAWASIFAASTALAGIWGMNFEHMPELKWVWGYPAALGVIGTVSAFLFYRFRRAGWL